MNIIFSKNSLPWYDKVAGSRSRAGCGYNRIASTSKSDGKIRIKSETGAKDQTMSESYSGSKMMDRPWSKSRTRTQAL